MQQYTLASPSEYNLVYALRFCTSQVILKKLQLICYWRITLVDLLTFISQLSFLWCTALEFVLKIAETEAIIFFKVDRT